MPPEQPAGSLPLDNPPVFIWNFLPIQLCSFVVCFEVCFYLTQFTTSQSCNLVNPSPDAELQYQVFSERYQERSHMLASLPPFHSFNRYFLSTHCSNNDYYILDAHYVSGWIVPVFQKLTVSCEFRQAGSYVQGGEWWERKDMDCLRSK